MSSESVTAETTSNADVWRRLFWLLGLMGSIAMLYYESTWSSFALHNRGTISFGAWGSTSAAIAAPWSFCMILVGELREAGTNGKIEREVCWKLCAWVAMVTLSVYWWFASDIRQLMNLGVLK
jgi:hypothetical protein